MPRPLNYKTAQSVSVTGYNPEIDQNSDPEDVWPLGGLIPFATTIGQVEVASDAANDDFAGPGAQIIQLKGITDQYEEFTEDIEMDGITPVLSTRTDYLHVQSASVIQSGPSLVNEGEITCELQGGVVNGIAPGKGESQSAAYVVPVNQYRGPGGQDAYLEEVWAMASKQANTEAIVAVVIYDPDLDTVYFSPEIPLNGGAGQFRNELRVPQILKAGTRIVLRVGEVTSNNTRVSGGFQIGWW